MLVKTVQVNTFKHAIDSVKDVLGDVTFVFIPQRGIVMPAVDVGKKAFVHLFFDAKAFEIFDVDSHVSATFEIAHLYKIVKNASSHNFDVLSMQLTDNALQVHMANSETDTSVSYALRLIKDVPRELDMPNLAFQIVFDIDARELARYLRDIQAVANTVKIRVKNRQAVMVAHGALGKCKIRIPMGQALTGSASLSLPNCVARPVTTKKKQLRGVWFSLYDVPSSEGVSGIFSVKYLSAFCKASCLGGMATLKLARGAPLCCEFNVGALGKLCFYLCHANGA